MNVFSFIFSISLPSPRVCDFKFSLKEYRSVFVKILLYFLGLLKASVINSMYFANLLHCSYFRNTGVFYEFFSEFLQHLSLREECKTRYSLGATVAVKHASEKMVHVRAWDFFKSKFWVDPTYGYSQLLKFYTKLPISALYVNLIVAFSPSIRFCLSERMFYLKEQPEFFKMISVGLFQFYGKFRTFSNRRIPVSVYKSEPVARLFIVEIVKRILFYMNPKWIRGNTFVLQGDTYYARINAEKIGKFFYSHPVQVKPRDFFILIFRQFMWITVFIRFSHFFLLEAL